MIEDGKRQADEDSDGEATTSSDEDDYPDQVNHPTVWLATK
jgi:hypothetical protein